MCYWKGLDGIHKIAIMHNNNFPDNAENNTAEEDNKTQLSSPNDDDQMQGADEIEQKSSTVANEEESKCVLEIAIINIIFVIIRHVFRYVAV